MAGGLHLAESAHLPPVSAAPILEYFDPQTLRLADEALLPAPIDDRGVVQICDTVKKAMSLVDPDYVWERDEPEPDVHHFVWERDWYHPRHFAGSRIPRDYRNIPFHMGYLPRQLHNFIHVTIAPPPQPDFEVMRYRAESYLVARELFKASSLAVKVHRKPEVLGGIERLDDGQLSITDEILKEALASITSRVLTKRQMVLPSNEFIDAEDIDKWSINSIARELGRIAAPRAVNMMPIVYGKRKQLAVA